jgi:hypothetical protein
MTEEQVLASWRPILRLIMFGVPPLVYLLNHFTLKLPFRLVGPLAVGLTALLWVWVATARALPQMDVAIERAGRVEDTDGSVLAALIEAPILAVIGTLPVMVVHLTLKWRARRDRGQAEVIAISS